MEELENGQREGGAGQIERGGYEGRDIKIEKV